MLPSGILLFLAILADRDVGGIHNFSCDAIFSTWDHRMKIGRKLIIGLGEEIFIPTT